MKKVKNKKERQPLDKMKIKSSIFVCFGLVLSAVVRSIAIHSFIVPNSFAPGGITGLSSMGEYLSVKFLPFKINSGILLFVLNIPLIIIAMIFINKKFALKTGAALFMSSALLLLWEKIQFPQLIGESSGDKILPALAGGILIGSSIALLLKCGGSSGGTDVIATLIQRKYSATNLAWFIFGLDAVVVLFSVFVYQNGLVPIILSFIEMFASSKVVETITQGFKSAIKFEIITSEPERISAEIIDKLKRGVTMSTVQGMYTHAEKAMLICIVRKRQVSQLKAIIKQYPDTFAYISSTSNVMGQGFTG